MPPCHLRNDPVGIGRSQALLPRMVASLKSNVEVDAVVQAVVNAHVEGGIESLVASMCADDEALKRFGFATFNTLTCQLGEPFSKCVVQVGGIQRMLEAVCSSPLL